ncbi:MAG: hypothetical protein JWN34_4925 [Bryobacterales bacterium]|nr:hypothetical protein [Bryobacterales bacterium]
MMYLAAIFCSPVYFAVRGKWLGFVINSILYVLALICLVTIIFAPGGFVFWMMGVIHAIWHLRHEMMVEHAELLATKMAEKMNAKASSQQ